MPEPSRKVVLEPAEGLEAGKQSGTLDSALFPVPEVPKFIEGIGEHVLQSEIKKTGTKSNPSPEVKLRGTAVSIVSNF